MYNLLLTEKYVGLPRAEKKKNRNKGDILLMLAQSVTETNEKH